MVQGEVEYMCTKGIDRGISIYLSIYIYYIVCIVLCVPIFSYRNVSPLLIVWRYVADIVDDALCIVVHGALF